MSEKYSKRKMEELLRQTSATLSDEADERIRGKLGIADAAASAKSVRAEDKEVVDFTGTTRRNEKRRTVMNFATVMALAAVVCAVLLTVWVHSLRKDPNTGEEGQVGTTVTVTPTKTEPTPVTISPTPTKPTPELKTVTMRDYCGQDYNTVIEKLLNLDMALQIRYIAESEYHEEYPVAGQVVRQIPSAGETLVEGQAVYLYYSIGRESIVIGDYTGMTSEQVRDAVENKLAIRIDWADSDVVEENHVIGTEPKAGESVPVGSTLTLILSQGSSMIASVPDVVGRREEDAKAILIAAKLNYEIVTAYSDAVPAGIVISQLPDSTIPMVERGAVIRLTVSAGPQPADLSVTPTPTVGPQEVRLNGENFPDDNFRQYIADMFDTNENGALDENEIAGVKTLRIGVNGGSIYCREIRDLKGLEYFTELEELHFSGNGVTELDVSSNTKLRRLTCSYNQLSSLDLSNNTLLENLDCSHNKIKELDLHNNPELFQLYAGNNSITSIDLTDCPLLKHLQLDRGVEVKGAGTEVSYEQAE